MGQDQRKGRPFYYLLIVPQSQVVVDTLTGEFKLLRSDILHDAGNSLNSAIDIGQIEGGFLQGGGWLTTEELVWDERGELKLIHHQLIKSLVHLIDQKFLT